MNIINYTGGFYHYGLDWGTPPIWILGQSGNCHHCPQWTCSEGTGLPWTIVATEDIGPARAEVTRASGILQLESKWYLTPMCMMTMQWMHWVTMKIGGMYHSGFDWELQNWGQSGMRQKFPVYTLLHLHQDRAKKGWCLSNKSSTFSEMWQE